MLAREAIYDVHRNYVWFLRIYVLNIATSYIQLYKE